MSNQNNQVEDLKNYEVKLKTTEKFNELFKIRMAVETETFDPSNNYDDGCKLRSKIFSSLFTQLFIDPTGTNKISYYDLFEIENVTPVEPKSFEVNVELSTSVKVSVSAWDEDDAECIATQKVEDNIHDYVDVEDLETYASDTCYIPSSLTDLETYGKSARKVA
tara:strand:+ start:148 stop:639 length:492 start_codon:yes stop_codon:yes gene_type:complete